MASITHSSLFSLPRRLPLRSTLFPYTTLFRSRHPREATQPRPPLGSPVRAVPGRRVHRRRASLARSEEHTSELQSLRHLVCRLLLEKKKEKEKNKKLHSLFVAMAAALLLAAAL